MSYQDFHVNGPATIDLLWSGDSAYVNLGITVDGPDVSNRGHFEDVLADDGGPAVPVDVQYFGEDAQIRLDIIRWDETQMRRLESRIAGKTVGQVRAVDIGTLMYRGLHNFKMRINATARTGLSAENTWIYNVCWAEDVIQFKPSTKVLRKSVIIRAIPDTSGVLYTRS